MFYSLSSKSLLLSNLLKTSSLSSLAKDNPQNSPNSESKSSKTNHHHIEFQNEGYINTQDIASFDNHTWICDSQNRFFKQDGLTTAISGPAPTSCKRIATDSNGDLYVTDSNRNLWLLRIIQQNSAAWLQISTTVVVSDVSVGPNGEVFVIDKDGNIFQVVNDQISTSSFNNKNDQYGDNCKIAVSFEKELVIYVADVNRDVYRVTAQLDNSKRHRIYPKVYADDLAVGQNFHLYVTTHSGIYRKKPISSDLYLVSDVPVASQISVGNKLWVVGYDNYPYSSTNNKV